MKTILTIFICFITMTVFAQDIKMDYYPEKKETVSSKDYSKGINELSYAYNDIKRRASSKYDYIDYWRVGIAYSYLEFDNTEVYEILKKSKMNSKKGFCIIFNHQLNSQNKPAKETRFYKFLGTNYIKDLNDCSGIDLKPVSNKKSREWLIKKEGGVIKWNNSNDKHNLKNNTSWVIYPNGKGCTLTLDSKSKSICNLTTSSNLLKTNKNDEPKWLRNRSNIQWLNNKLRMYNNN